MTAYEQLQRDALARGYRLERGSARNPYKTTKPTDFIVWRYGLWTYYRTLKQAKARIDSGF